MTTRWFRDIYRDAVWESEDLTAVEKAVAETYARHARDANDAKTPNADLAWLTYPRLMAKAGIGRRANVSAAVASLVSAGWLTVEREVSRRPTVYRLTIPNQASAPTKPAGSSGDGTTVVPEINGGSSSSGTTVVPEINGGSSSSGTTVVPKIASGSSTFRPGSSDGGTQPLRPSVEEPLTSSPHQTRADARAPLASNRREEEAGSDFDQEARTIGIINNVHGIRPEWSRRKIRDAITTARNEGRSLDLIEKVFPIVAADPNTRFPGRLPNDGDWWNINQQGCVGVRENANARAAAGWLTIPVDDRPIMHPLTRTPPTP